MRYKNQAVRNKILKEFNTLYKKNGYEKATMTLLYKACNMSPGHISFYFKKKEDIVIAALVDLLNCFTKVIKNSTDLPNDLFVEYHFRVVLFAYIANIDKLTYRLLSEIPEIYPLQDKMIEVSCTTLIKATKQYRLPVDELDVWSACVASLCSYFMLIRRFYYQNLPVNYYRVYHFFCDVLYSQLNFPEVANCRSTALAFFESIDKEAVWEAYSEEVNSLYSDVDDDTVLEIDNV